MKTITPEAFAAAAEELGVETAAIKAVAEVESVGSGFLDDGHVRILFERHKFHKFTDGHYDTDHPGISDPKAGGYGPAGEHQNERFNEAFALDPDAAMMSASWGAFQIMGFNFKVAGFNSVGEFVDAMKVSEDEQLKAFVNVIRAFGLAPALKKHDWAAFARQYNGGDYKINRYDEKLKKAYEKFKAEPEPVEAPPAVEIPIAENPDGGKSGEPVPEKPAEAGQAVVGGRPEDPPKQVTKGSTPTKIAVGGGAILSGLTVVWNYIEGHPNAAVTGIICVTVLILVFVFRQIILDYARLQLGGDPSKYNVK
jgi:hypothetical protein